MDLGHIPGWLSAIGILFTLASVLGTAASLFRISLYEAKLKDADRTIDSLRGDIGDYMRRITDHEKRETVLEGQVKLLEADRTNCHERIKHLEDLLTKRSDDAEIRMGIAELKRTVDDELRLMLIRIETAVTMLPPPTGTPRSGSGPPDA